MENKLLNLYRTLMSQLGLSVDMMNISQSEQWYTDFQQLMWNLYFSKSDQEILDSIVFMKNTVCKTLYETDFCPFETLTGVPWEAMLRASFVRKGKPEGGLQRVFLPWIHVATSSDQYSFKIPKQINPEWVKKYIKYPLVSQPEYVAQECIEIDGNMYTYGEARIIIDRIPIGVNRSMVPSLYFAQPTTVFDSNLLPSLIRQSEWPQVFEILCLLFESTSHDGFIHAVFLEGDTKIIDFTNKDATMKKLNEVKYHCFNMYEINFSRMMRAVFDIIFESNPTIRADIMNLLEMVKLLSEHWPSVLRQYVTYIATERVSRIIWLDSLYPTLEKYFVGLKNKGLKCPPLKAVDAYLNIFIHINPHEGALVYKEPSGEEFEEIPFSTMTRFMYNCHMTV